ncbi:MAG: hypothetical protein AAFV45_02360 [Pseudomonadota bacterium]
MEKNRPIDDPDEAGFAALGGGIFDAEPVALPDPDLLPDPPDDGVDAALVFEDAPAPDVAPATGVTRSEADFPDVDVPELDLPNPDVPGTEDVAPDFDPVVAPDGGTDPPVFPLPVFPLAELLPLVVAEEPVVEPAVGFTSVALRSSVA